MNIKGREKELVTKFKTWNRLISFFEEQTQSRHNNIMNVINCNKDEDILINSPALKKEDNDKILASVCYWSGSCGS